MDQLRLESYLCLHNDQYLVKWLDLPWANVRGLGQIAVFTMSTDNFNSWKNLFWDISL